MLLNDTPTTSKIAWPRGGANTEKWRSAVAKIADWAPVDFLLSWIDKESGGDVSEVTYLGERGLFQEHPAEKGILGLSDEDFERLTTDPAFSLATGVRHAKLYAVFTKRFLAEVGTEWHGRDFWKLVKLHHGAFSIPKYTLNAFKKQYGRAPETWDELQTYALAAAKDPTGLGKDMPAAVRSLVPSTFANADDTGEISQIPKVSAKTVAMAVPMMRAHNLLT